MRRIEDHIQHRLKVYLSELEAPFRFMMVSGLSTPTLSAPVLLLWNNRSISPKTFDGLEQHHKYNLMISVCTLFETYLFHSIFMFIMCLSIRLDMINVANEDNRPRLKQNRSNRSLPIEATGRSPASPFSAFYQVINYYGMVSLILTTEYNMMLNWVIISRLFSSRHHRTRAFSFPHFSPRYFCLTFPFSM